MKTYGNGMKATEFSKKQINVIYGKAKAGELKVEKWIINDLYNMADFYGYDDNRSVERAEADIIALIDKVFAGNLEEAQQLIDLYTEDSFNRLGIKAQKKANRSFVA